MPVTRGLGACLFFLLLSLALLVHGPRVVAEPVIPAAEALDRLRDQGFLQDLTVSGTLDLGDLAAQALPAGGFRMERVHFQGPVILHDLDLGADLRLIDAHLAAGLSLENCTLRTLVVENSEIAGLFEIVQCAVQGSTFFENSRIHGSTRFHLVELGRRPVFDRMQFDGPAEFLECRFATAEPPALRGRGSVFSDVRFSDSVLFNNSMFQTEVRFQSVLFAADAAFLNVRMPAGTAFRGCHFKGDAEFRFCRVGDADFGNRDNITLFAGRADFRGCEFAAVRFDYAELRGEVSLVDARLGPGGASFRFANLAGPADFNTLHSEGPLDLAHAYVPHLSFRWRELRHALLDADPDTRTLAALHARTQALGDVQGKQDTGYLLERARFRESVDQPLPSLQDAPLEYVDAIGQRLVRYGEWVLWGWPSGYGNKLGRAVFIALMIWLLAALPMVWTPGVLARNATAEGVPIHDPLPVRTASDGLYSNTKLSRLRDALWFTFRLLFKVGGGAVRFVSEDPDSGRARRWRRYFVSLWYLGSGLLLLLTLTLANTSPVIEKLIRGLFP